MEETANTRNLRALFLRSVAEKGQLRIVERLNTTPTRVSRFFSDDEEGGKLMLSEVLAAIDEAGLTLVRTDAEMVDPDQRKEKDDYIKALETVVRYKLSESK
jgi:hypothetical protein